MTSRLREPLGIWKLLAEMRSWVYMLGQVCNNRLNVYGKYIWYKDVAHRVICLRHTSRISVEIDTTHRPIIRSPFLKKGCAHNASIYCWIQILKLSQVQCFCLQWKVTRSRSNAQSKHIRLKVASPELYMWNKKWRDPRFLKCHWEQSSSMGERLHFPSAAADTAVCPHTLVWSVTQAYYIE